MKGNEKEKDRTNKQTKTYQDFLMNPLAGSGSNGDGVLSRGGSSDHIERTLAADCVVREAHASKALKWCIGYLTLGIATFIAGVLIFCLYPARSISTAAARSPIFLLSSFLLQCSRRHWIYSCSLNDDAFQASRARTAYLITKENGTGSELLAFAKTVMEPGPHGSTASSKPQKSKEEAKSSGKETNIIFDLLKARGNQEI